MPVWHLRRRSNRPGISQAKGPQGEGTLESRHRFADVSPKVKAGPQGSVNLSGSETERGSAFM